VSEKKHHVAVITGGGTGIGAATAVELAAHGVRVIVVGRRQEPLQETEALIASRGGEALAYLGDVRGFPALERLALETMERFGRIDLVVPNAAVHDASNIVDGDPHWWRTLIDINVVGLMNTVRAFLPHMCQQGFGHFIVVSSVSGRVTYTGEPAYVASKHAQVAFADCLRQEVSSRGIRVTVVEPGLVDTPMSDDQLSREMKKTVTPLEPEDCARAIRFAFEQPPNCVINEIVLRPLKQEL
jgi:NADP-dependent 3-hydroxy acid dehydrogenase YdfG